MDHRFWSALVVVTWPDQADTMGQVGLISPEDSIDFFYVDLLDS